MTQTPKYVVEQKVGLFTTNRHEAYTMKDIQAIVSGLMREAKANGTRTIALTIALEEKAL